MLPLNVSHTRSRTCGEEEDWALTASEEAWSPRHSEQGKKRSSRRPCYLMRISSSGIGILWPCCRPAQMLAAKVTRAFRESAPEVPTRELSWHIFNGGMLVAQKWILASIAKQKFTGNRS